MESVWSLLSVFFGCRHDWSFPTTVRRYKQKVYNREFNSHQTCTCCGRERLFNSETWTPGPRIHPV